MYLYLYIVCIWDVYMYLLYNTYVPYIYFTNLDWLKLCKLFLNISIPHWSVRALAHNQGNAIKLTAPY